MKVKIKVEKPYKDRPLAVFNSSRILVVRLEHDPGEKYTEGFNVFTSYEVLPIPPIPSL